ncbi:MAG: aconitase X catalytic domain-containing protein [Anaerolineales bacterium]
MSLELTEKDRQMLDGKHGEAARIAMSIVVRMAEILEVEKLMDITQAHIDGCGLMSDASLDFAETMARLGGKVVVPTTLNMIPLDLQNWQKQEIPEEFAHKALRMANAYIQMGCIPTWTCAPYQGAFIPFFGQQIAWGESNAIAYANSVLGARTNRYADFFDLCAAITGRVPEHGLHLEENRRGQVLFRLKDIPDEWFSDDSFYPVLGHLIGKIAQDRIPVIEGLKAGITSDQHKAFGAAAASAGAVGMYHMVGITPEAPNLEAAFHGLSPHEIIELGPEAILEARKELSTISETEVKVNAIILGCPHFSFTEFQRLYYLIQENQGKLSQGMRFIVVTNQMTYSLLERSNILQPLFDFGIEIVLDTCVFHSPILKTKCEVVMTNSGKAAYYAPGELKTNVIFGTLEECVRAAIDGKVYR